MARIEELFEDKNTIKIIQKKLPYLFHLAEVDASRAGQVGMEIGSVRERVLIALLMYKFGSENVETDLPITEKEVDVKLFNESISIKTITGKGTTGIKVIWTVDAKKAEEFVQTYAPYCDLLLVKINWNDRGGMYYIPLSVQQDIFYRYGRDEYFKLPKKGTNPRGVEFAKESMADMLTHNNTKVIDILWMRPTEKINPYKRWLDYWAEN